MKTFSLIAIIAGIFLITQPVHAGVAIIVNADSGLSSAKKGEIKKIFLGKIKKISGHPLKPVDNTSEEVRKIFLKKIVKKKPRAFKSYWTRLVFSGKSSPLASGGDDKGVKQWINNHPDSIGFISTDNVDDSIKVIFSVD